MIFTPTTSGVSSGAEGTDTGKSSMSKAANGEKIGSDTALRNGSNGLNNSIQQQPDSLNILPTRWNQQFEVLKHNFGN